MICGLFPYIDTTAKNKDKSLNALLIQRSKVHRNEILPVQKSIFSEKENGENNLSKMSSIALANQYHRV